VKLKREKKRRGQENRNHSNVHAVRRGGDASYKGRGPNDKWYECGKCHKTWRRMRVTSAAGEKEAPKDIVE